MCGTSICAVLLWLVDFFGVYFVYVIDDLSFAAVVGGIDILDENVRTVWIQDVCINGSNHIIFPIINLCFFPPPAHTQPCVDNSSEYADNTDNATTLPSSTSNGRQHHHARVAYPYVAHCCCGYVLHFLVSAHRLIDTNHPVDPGTNYTGCGSKESRRPISLMRTPPP